MRTDISAHKRELAAKAEQELPLLLVGYKSGDLPSLGRLCDCICILREYLAENPRSEAAKKSSELLEYLSGKFQNDIVLVLSKNGRCYAYTLHDVTRFVRGESVHGASDNRGPERQVIHDYVFEKDDEIESEFFVGWTVVSGPNLRAQAGNIDSGGPYLHAVTINGHRREVSLIESVILAGTFEFWQTATRSDPRQSSKVFVKFDPLEFVALFGQKISQKLLAQLVERGFIRREDSPTSASSE